RASSPATSPATTEWFDAFSPPPGDSEVINHFERLRPYVLGVKVAHPRDKLRSGVASEWPKPSPKLSEGEPWISITGFSSVWTSRN
ncbi:hypothetical protein NKH84_32015, partial [Mesorhizobium sp. M0902]|uniref:hypothetical protein n=1 Tax=Mesorhizobium sp. M0902 TaxID=2957021 RepID=UPI00333554D7